MRHKIAAVLLALGLAASIGGVAAASAGASVTASAPSTHYQW